MSSRSHFTFIGNGMIGTQGKKNLNRFMSNRAYLEVYYLRFEIELFICFKKSFGMSLELRFANAFCNVFVEEPIIYLN